MPKKIVYTKDYLEMVLNKQSDISDKVVKSGVYLIYRTIMPLSMYNRKHTSILCYIGSSNDVEKRIKDPNHIYRKLQDELNYTNTFEVSVVAVYKHYTKDYFNLESQLIQFAKPHYNKTIKK